MEYSGQGLKGFPPHGPGVLDTGSQRNHLGTNMKEHCNYT